MSRTVNITEDIVFVSSGKFDMGKLAALAANGKFDKSVIPDDALGCQWYSGTNNPSQELGDNNDYYLNTTTGDIFKKAEAWTLIGNIMGPKGTQGMQGPQGMKGDKGDSGEQGETGPQGPRGEKGNAGEVGPKGDSGAVGPQGPKGDTGPIGAQGLPGSAGANGAAGIGVPMGGSAGQVLTKVGSTDFHTEWTDQSGGTGSGNLNLKQWSSANKVNVGDKKNLPLANTPNFSFLAPTVLREETGAQDIMTTVNQFDNEESASFKFDPEFIEFANGKMQVRTSFPLTVTANSTNPDCQYYRSTVNASNYKNMEGVVL